MADFEPPFTLTPEIMDLCVHLAEKLGAWKAKAKPSLKIKLRKENRIKTIHSSLVIEGNSLSLDQVTAVLEGKKIIAPKKDLLEVTNAIKVYSDLENIRFASEKSFLTAHSILMNGLIPKAGKYRTSPVGILKGSKVSHIPPPAKQVPLLMANLFQWLKTSSLNAFIKSSIAHYEIEFIHPFMDGNGRMGRLWQTLVLNHSYHIFGELPVEHLIQKNQKEYYQALEHSDRQGNSAPFILFMLKVLMKTLDAYLISSLLNPSDSASRLESIKETFKKVAFSRLDYLKAIGSVSTATASRDLKFGVNEKILKVTGNKRNARYHFL
jgi:Fic family protein